MKNACSSASAACSTLVVAVLLAAGTFAGCSMDYEQSVVAEERPEDVPETVMIEATFTVVRTGSRLFSIEAARAETYPERGERVFTALSFQEIAADGTLLTRGTADHAVFETESENVELSGAVEFFSETEEAGISTPYLFWNDEERILTAREDDLVRVERTNGSVIEGTGFSSDLRLKVVTFSGRVQGRLVTDE